MSAKPPAAKPSLAPATGSPLPRQKSNVSRRGAPSGSTVPPSPKDGDDGSEGDNDLTLSHTVSNPALASTMSKVLRSRTMSMRGKPPDLAKTTTAAFGTNNFASVGNFTSAASFSRPRRRRKEDEDKAREEEERQMEEEQRMLAEAAADLRKELLRLNKCIKGIDKIVEFTSNTHSARIEIDSQYKPTIERHRRHKRREMHLQEASANTRGQAGERRALIRHLEATIGVMQHKLPEWRDAQEDLLDALEVEVALIEDVAADLANTEVHTFPQAAINTSMRLVTEVDGGRFQHLAESTHKAQVTLSQIAAREREIGELTALVDLAKRAHTRSVHRQQLSTTPYRQLKRDVSRKESPVRQQEGDADLQSTDSDDDLEDAVTLARMDPELRAEEAREITAEEAIRQKRRNEKRVQKILSDRLADEHRVAMRSLAWQRQDLLVKVRDNQCVMRRKGLPSLRTLFDASNDSANDISVTRSTTPIDVSASTTEAGCSQVGAETSTHYDTMVKRFVDGNINKAETEKKAAVLKLYQQIDSIKEEKVKQEAAADTLRNAKLERQRAVERGIEERKQIGKRKGELVAEHDALIRRLKVVRVKAGFSTGGKRNLKTGGTDPSPYLVTPVVRVHAGTVIDTPPTDAEEKEEGTEKPPSLVPATLDPASPLATGLTLQELLHWIDIAVGFKDPREELVPPGGGLKPSFDNATRRLHPSLPFVGPKGAGRDLSHDDPYLATPAQLDILYRRGQHAPAARRPKASTGTALYDRLSTTKTVSAAQREKDAAELRVLVEHERMNPSGVKSLPDLPNRGAPVVVPRYRIHPTEESAPDAETPPPAAPTSKTTKNPKSKRSPSPTTPVDVATASPSPIEEPTEVVQLKPLSEEEMAARAANAPSELKAFEFLQARKKAAEEAKKAEEEAAAAKKAEEDAAAAKKAEEEAAAAEEEAAAAAKKAEEEAAAEETTADA